MDDDEHEDTNNIYNRIYGQGGEQKGATMFGGIGADEVVLEDDTNYVEPRTSYPADRGIMGFDQM